MKYKRLFNEAEQIKSGDEILSDAEDIDRLTMVLVHEIIDGCNLKGISLLDAELIVMHGVSMGFAEGRIRRAVESNRKTINKKKGKQ